MKEIHLIGINHVYDPKNLPYYVEWQEREYPARSMDEANALARALLLHKIEDDCASVFKVTSTSTSQMIKRFTVNEDGGIDVWQRR